jgi:4-amino-4-deoxychorismate lyase
MTVLALAVSGRGVVDPADPAVFADDEAFLRGRAAFETIRVYAGRPFKLEEHLRRLAVSAERIALPAPDLDLLRSLAGQALAAAGAPDAVLRLYWTPGREGVGEPHGLALVGSIPSAPDEARAHGIRVVALPLGVSIELRHAAPWLLGGVKATSYAVNMAAEAEARRRGADDAIFLAAGDIVLEGPVTNVWWRRGETLFTPSLDIGILAGVTRGSVIELAAAEGYRVEEGVYRLPELAAAEEAFTSSSVRELMPVVELDGAPVGDGRPGPAAARLQTALRRLAGGEVRQGPAPG